MSEHIKLLPGDELTMKVLFLDVDMTAAMFVAAFVLLIASLIMFWIEGRALRETGKLLKKAKALVEEAAALALAGSNLP